MSTAESPAAATALTDEQKARLVAGVADMLRDIVVGSPAALPEKLSELADVPLSGAFVSLKRGKHLRSCCGIVGRTVSLRQALERAADRAIWEDERFPPVSANELEHLDLEVWLLRNPERVSARGEERASAIEVGRHGVKVVRGQANGLFLPSVAAEHSWDARRFLDQVCVKAGLPPTAWLDDDTEVYTFEGEVVRGNVATPDGPRQAGRLVGPCRAEDVATFAALCRDNLAALLAGASPRYFWGAPDGQVNGVLLFLHRPGRNELRQFSRYSLRPGLPLQSTLFSLLQAAAQDLAALGPTGDESWQLGLMFLHDPVLHGTVADAQLAGFEPHRAVLVLERGKTGLAFDPEKPAAELLEAAARAARVTKPESAGVYSLDAVSNVNRVMASTAPVPARGPAVRPAAVAGQFYDADADALGRLVDRILGHGRRQERWPAAMVPHAGLKFSGRVAAEVLRRIRFPKTVIAIGPKHTPLGCEWAVAPHQTWAIPGGGVASDPALARKLCDAIPGLELDAAAHLREHGTEVELPLISRLAPDTKVVGIALGHGDLESCRRFAEGLASVVRGMEEKPLLLISSDMNHFANDADTRRLDALALAALETGDPAKLYGTVTDNNISMCGVLPAVIVLETLRLLDGFHKAERVAYATSADTTGDTSRVVGYAGVLLG